MAEEARPKEETSSNATDPATPIIVTLGIALLLGSIFFVVQRYIMSSADLREFFQTLSQFFLGKASLRDVFYSTGSAFMRWLYFILQILSIFLTALFLWLIITTIRKVNKLRHILHAPLHPHEDHHHVPTGTAPKTREVNPKWLKVLGHINSDNPSDWKLAILEADIMLDEMLDKMNYPGQTIGEKLKMVERSDFDTLDNAWEAHKIRNSIAHEGSDFALPKKEAERVITLFETVFKEFKYI